VRSRLETVWSRLSPGAQRFVRFGLVGASGVVVNLAFMAIGLHIFDGLAENLREGLASALGICLSVVSNFVLNDAWTWGDRSKGPRKRDWLMRLTAYSVGAGVGAALQFGAFLGLRTWLDVPVYLAQVAGILLGTVVNFIINNRVVFRDRARATE
jgi:dolichol-phosphate mannosyltransferase